MLIERIIVISFVNQKIEKEKLNYGIVYRREDSSYSSIKFMCNAFLQDGSKCSKQGHAELLCNCSKFFFKSINGIYVSYSQQKIGVFSIMDHTKLFSCKHIISSKQNCNINPVSNHERSVDYEFIDKDRLVKNTLQECKLLNQLYCLHDFPYCYNFTDICIYRLNDFSHLIPCRTGSHLEYCRHFQCNLHFKCPGYYCIPWSFTCDGKWDCPNGYDESPDLNCGFQRICFQMFSCKNSQLCIHLEDICDGNYDCPFSDDELLCALKGYDCPIGCTCLEFAIICHARNITYQILNKLPFIYYHLIRLHYLVLSVLQNSLAVIVILKYNSIQHICNINYENTVLSFLDLSHNDILRLSTECFSDSKYLRKLSLKNNSVFSIEPKAFSNLPNLFSVDLSINKLNTIQKGIFRKVTNMYILIVYANPFKNIHSEMFSGLSIKIIHSNNFQICCFSIEHSKCTQPTKWYNSCNNLLPNESLRILFLIVSVLVFLANILLIVLKVTMSSSSRKSYFIIVLMLAFTHIYMAVNTFLIFCVDLYFGSRFASNIFHWRSSMLCALIYSGFLTFNLLQPFLLLILSVVRLMVVQFPFKSKDISRNITLKVIISGQIIVMSFSMTFGIIVKHQVSPNDLCFPFTDPIGGSWPSISLTVVVSFLQVFIILITLVMYMLMIKILRKPEAKSSSNDKSRKHVLKHVILLTLSKVLSWIPSNIIYLTSLGMEKYPILMIYWIIGIVAPMNAIIIPFLLV